MSIKSTVRLDAEVIGALAEIAVSQGKTFDAVVNEALRYACKNFHGISGDLNELAITRMIDGVVCNWPSLAIEGGVCHE